MDKSAPLNVAQGTIITSATSAFVTGLYGIFTRNSKYGVLAGAAAINSGITATTFFALREYVVSPVLVSTFTSPQYSRRRKELSLDRTETGVNDPAITSGQLSWSEMRTHKTLDTGISGAFTGGVLRGWKSGPQSILPGVITGAIICTMLQFAYNELGIARIKYVSHSLQGSQESSVIRHRPSPQSPSALETDQNPPEPSKPFLERLLAGLGLHKVTDDEYLARMKQTRDMYLQNIRKLEEQVEEERRQKESESRSSDNL